MVSTGCRREIHSLDMSQYTLEDLGVLKRKVERQMEHLKSANFQEGKISCTSHCSDEYRLYVAVDGTRSGKPCTNNKEIFKGTNISEVITFIDDLISDLNKTKEHFKQS